MAEEMPSPGRSRGPKGLSSCGRRCRGCMCDIWMQSEKSPLAESSKRLGKLDRASQFKLCKSVRNGERDQCNKIRCDETGWLLWHSIVLHTGFCWHFWSQGGCAIWGSVKSVFPGMKTAEWPAGWLCPTLKFSILPWMRWSSPHVELFTAPLCYVIAPFLQCWPLSEWPRSIQNRTTRSTLTF